jgi:hypothetical protein
MLHRSLRHLLVVLVVCLPAATGAAQSGPANALAIPHGRAVLADGRLEPEEWRDAREVPAAAEARLFLKRDDQFLYVAVVPTTPALFGVNLYLGEGDAPAYLNLHASAKLGERRGRAGAWPEWTWWNNAGWAANVVRLDSFDDRRFLPDSAKEFQIRLDRIPSSAFTLSVDLERAQGTTPLRFDAPERDGLHWLTLRL